MTIVDFAPEHGEAFRLLNEAWITRHFTLEPHDREQLEDPQGHVLAGGGRIFIALDEAGEAVGCVAMIAMADGGFEVAKMTVAESQRGTGLGRRLMQRCIDAGREAGAPRLYLETNSSLAPAISLYRAMGFQDLARVPSLYVRADVFMELRLAS
jgi:ribosomal protein S18 acetylase RimI-like enzyme